MRYRFVGLLMMLCSLGAAAEVSLSIGINLPGFPVLQRVPGYPVYYAPRLDSNYFFYDGLYWIYDNDNWYASSWYNGPWGMVDRFDVPVYVLRVPVRYYRRAPAYFQGWRQDAPPRWGQHWGASWEQRRSGWDRWNRGSAPTPAPLPTYQRQYSGDRYPQAREQAVIQTRNYRYQPRDSVARQRFEQIRVQAPAPQRVEKRVQQQAPAPQRVEKRIQQQERRVEKRADQQEKRVEKRADQQERLVEKRVAQQEKRVEKRVEQQEKRVEKRVEKQQPRVRDKDDRDERGKGRDR